VDGAELVGLDGTTLVDGLTNNIDDSTESLGADGNHDGGAGVGDSLATHETLSGVHSDGAYIVSTQVLGDLKNEDLFSVLNTEGVENGGELSFELYVDDGTNNLRNLSVGRSKSTYKRV